jgi:16S rRNA (uracil1498-N3)-methyltransferase
MADRYFSEIPITGDAVTLSGQEAHHLRDVMRSGRGDRVLLFDGSGFEFVAEVIEAKRGAVELLVVERLAVDRELPWPLKLGVALPKGERQRWLLEKAVEIGVTRLVPLLCERGVADPTPSALERLRRGVVEATKQCGRNRLLQIDEPLKLAEYARHAATDSLRLLAHPGGTQLAGLAAAKGGTGVSLAIGPEGGFSATEVEVARDAGWRTISLGPRVLRVETAAVLLAGLAAQGCFFE